MNKEAIVETFGLIISVFTFVYYVIFSMKELGITRSISYTFEKHKKENKKYFPLFMIIFSLALTPFAIYDSMPITGVSLILIALTGAFPYVANKKILKIHMLFIFSGIAGTIIDMGFNGMLDITPSLVALGLIIISLLSRKKVYLIEVILFLYVAYSFFESIGY